MLSTSCCSRHSIESISKLLKHKLGKCHFSFPKQSNRKPYSTKATNGFTSSRLSHTLLLSCITAGVGGIILLTSCKRVSDIQSPYYIHTYCEDSNGKKLHLSQKDTVMELNKRLKIVRQKLAKQGKPTPDLLVSSSLGENDTHHRNDTEWCEIRFEIDRHVNIGSLLKHWFQVTLKENYNNKANNSNNNSNTGTSNSATPMFKMLNGSMIATSHDHSTRLQWYTDKQGHIVSVKKSPGFNNTDVDDIVKGYEEVLLSFFQNNNDDDDEVDDDSLYNSNNSSSNRSNIADDPTRFLQYILKNLIARGGGEGLPPSFQVGDDEEELLFQKHNRAPSASDKSSNNTQSSMQRGDKRSTNNTLTPLEKLEKLGIPVYNKQSIGSNKNSNKQTSSSVGKSTKSSSSSSSLETDTIIDAKPLTWDHLAGYDEIKRQIEDTVINSYLHGDVYDSVVKATRLEFESNCPTALLLSGPPGTGKTLTARILASQCNRPLIVLKLEHIMSKWYGESEKKLTEIFDICEVEMNQDGVIIFIDEVDALATSRGNNGNDDNNGYSGGGGGGGNMHEVTRRLLSVLLQKIEGFQGKSSSLIIAATNRHQDLDPALISRFDLIIQYPLPDVMTRKAIIQRYAKQFSNHDEALNQLAQISKHLSCRDIKEACENVERKWASKIIKNEIKKTDVIPSLQEYLISFQSRKNHLHLNRQQQSINEANV